MRPKLLLLAAGLLLAGGLLLAVVLVPRASRGRPDAAARADAYVGSERCASCHAGEYAKWTGSHHQLAMQPARPGTVLGDFANASLDVRGETWRFMRRGEAFVARAEGPDGALHDYDVAYTFGVDPLQQYLIAFPGGRLQALSAAWDTRAKRWFFLSPGRDVPPSDWLHWTRQGQNWNTMCADCHSTNVVKGFDADADSFRTTWSDVTVGCEACHGPASRHVAWAGRPALLRLFDAGHGFATKTTGLPSRALVELCAPCHSRRAQLADQGPPGTPLLDRYLPTLLEPGLFYPDGQILDEDYEYHSFTQSKMYANGVACRDCHDMHSGERLAGGNALCTRCHAAAKYDTKRHHFHETSVKGKASDGALCVSCHMPGRNYMVVHFRRDHSLRVPRPDLTVAIGTPNACNASGCHTDQSAAWAAAKVSAWYGPVRKPHFGPALAAGMAGKPDAAAALVGVVRDPDRPPVVRATALSWLAGYPGADTDAALERALVDADPLVRRTAAASLPLTDPTRYARLLAPLVRDPVRAVRAEAGGRLAALPEAALPAPERAAAAAALADYVETQRYASDMPSGPYNLANLEMARGRAVEAEMHYRRALAIDDQFVPAKSNLAMLLARLGRNGEAEPLLREIVAARPHDAGAAFNLGLLLAEGGKPAEAERMLRASLQADSAFAPAAYNLAVLIAAHAPGEALSLAKRAATLRPDEPKYAWTYAFYQARAGDRAGAIETLRALLQRVPGDPDATQLLGRLERSAPPGDGR